MLGGHHWGPWGPLGPARAPRIEGLLGPHGAHGAHRAHRVFKDFGRETLKPYSETKSLGIRGMYAQAIKDSARRYVGFFVYAARVLRMKRSLLRAHVMFSPGTIADSMRTGVRCRRYAGMNPRGLRATTLTL